MKPHLLNQTAIILKTYKSDHDQGSGSIDATDPQNIRITPVKHWNNRWAWWSIRHGKLGGTTPHFLIAKADHYNLVTGEWLACWARAADTDTWYPFDHVTIGATDIEFYNDTPFPSGKIYIAALPMYPFSRIRRKMAAWLPHAHVTDTPSGTNGIIGNATARTVEDGSNRTAPALPYYAFKLTNTTPGTKNKIILMTLDHAIETPGAFVFEAAIDWLLAGSDLAEFLLDYCEFYGYFLNSQAVWSGWFRSSPDLPTQGHDTWIDELQYAEDTIAIKTAQAADTAGAIDVGLSFHSIMTDTDIHAAVHTGDTTGLYEAFRARMAALDSAFNLYATDLTTASVDYFKQMGAALAMELEQGLGTARGIPEWKTYGQRLMQTLALLVADGQLTQNPGIGSRDFNGSTDRLDWTNVLDLAGSALTISLWVKIDALSHTNYLFCPHRSGDAAYAIIFAVLSNGTLFLERAGSTSIERDSVAGAITTGAWVHLLVTHTGTFNDKTTIKLYKNGAELTYTAGGLNGAGEYAATGKWSLGGRSYDDARNLDGKLAQVAVWNRVITPTEIAALAAGYSPQLAAASGMQFYFKGNTSSLADEITAATATADGTTQLTGATNGPSIIY